MGFSKEQNAFCGEILAGLQKLVSSPGLPSALSTVLEHVNGNLALLLEAPPAALSKLWTFIGSFHAVIASLLSVEIGFNDVNRLPDLVKKLEELGSFVLQIRGCTDPEDAEVMLDRMIETTNIAFRILRDGVKQSLNLNKKKHIEVALRDALKGATFGSAAGSTTGAMVGLTSESCTCASVLGNSAKGGLIGLLVGTFVIGGLTAAMVKVSYDTLKSEILFEAKKKALSLADHLGNAKLAAKKVKRACSGEQKEAIAECIEQLQDLQSSLLNYDPERDS